MISKLIQEKVEMRFGRPIRYAKDCEILAGSIHAFTGEKISCSTVKRLFGLIESDNEPRLYTLDILAQYLGYINYDNLLQEFNPNKHELTQSIETIAKDTDRDNFMSADQAQEYGLIDKVIDKRP